MRTEGWAIAAVVVLVGSAVALADYGAAQGNSPNRLILLEGSAASPPLSFTADPNTGPWHPASDEFGVSCGGVNCFKVTTTAINFENLPLTKFLTWIENSTAGVGAPNVLLDESGRTVTNIGVTALCYQELPAATAGFSQTFVCADADGLRIDAVGDDVIHLGGAQSAAGGYISTVTTGTTITLAALDSTRWYATTGQFYNWLIDGVSPGYGARGRAWVSTPASTDASSAALMAGTFSDGQLIGFTRSGGRLTYAGRATLRFVVTANIYARVDAVQSVGDYTFQIYKNGAPVVGDISIQQFGVQSTHHGVGITSFHTGVTGDYWEVYITGPDASSDITAGIGSSLSVVETGTGIGP